MMKPEVGKTYVFYDKQMKIMGVGTYQEVRLLGATHSQIQSYPRCSACGIHFCDVEAWSQVRDDMTHMRFYPYTEKELNDQEDKTS